MRAIPDPSLSLADGAVKPFQTKSGEECQRDLLHAAAARKVSTRTPFEKLSQAHKHWVLFGEDPARSGEDLWKEKLWYGVRGYFQWLESKSYKMHVRVLLSRYRTYTLCPDCQGGRFAPDTLHFRWGGLSAPQLMGMAVSDLHRFLEERAPALGADPTAGLLAGEIESRLRYLLEVGLGYLTLDRPTRSLSGGETARVNLTTCLGTSLVNALFVLDEPSIGLHPRDTGRLLDVIRRLRDRGNTLVVVEHEEAVLRAADHFVEIGPGRGEAGGELVYSGPAAPLLSGAQRSLTGDYLTGRKAIPVPKKRRTPQGWIRVEGASAHNLRDLDVRFPLGVFCCVTGVSGSGKSTLVHHVLYRQLAARKGLELDEPPGACRALQGAELLDSVVLVDQSALSKTPRSSPALYLGVFDEIRDHFAASPEAQAAGLKAGDFSFNSGNGRCERCSGSGFEKIEMQFLSDVFVRCPECEGRRFQAHVRKIKSGGLSIDGVLDLTVTEALDFFGGLGLKKVEPPLRALEQIGLGYLRLGQPLNGLSGGESQRLKLVERLVQGSGKNALIVLDEPTTGLHFDDIVLLLGALNQLVERGHSILVIEHNTDVIRNADHVIDLGPEAGAAGGYLVATGTPEEIAACPASHTGRFLSARPAEAPADAHPQTGGRTRRRAQAQPAHLPIPAHPGASPASEAHPRVAEAESGNPADSVSSAESDTRVIRVTGARQHNLKNISVEIPRDALAVITGLSGSGKSSLAFDLLFAEGQRRFLDSMSPYARQFAVQLERPDVDRVSGLPPSVAIEQRLTRGGGKSTVATVTEVYHFLRLLFSKVGLQHCPDCAEPVQRQTLAAAVQKAQQLAARGRLRVLAPLVRARKGFHTEVAQWAVRHGFHSLLVDGKWERADAFPKLSRYNEHTIELLVGEASADTPLAPLMARAFEIGAGTALLLDHRNKRQVLSTEHSCPACSRSFEELDPRLFSFNSPHGWCTSCHGFGEEWTRRENPRLDSALEIELDHERQHEALESGEARPCPACAGSRLNPVARAVRVGGLSIDALVHQTAGEVLLWTKSLRFTGNAARIAADVLPEISQRLKFLDEVGLGYLSLGRSAKTLSGGESQRIRLAAQLGSNLRGVLYILDEPTIGLHPRDNLALLDTLEALKNRGNSLVVVEHDEETLLRADHIIDLGPGAGKHGGRVIAQGRLDDLRRSPLSATGACLREPLRHPTRGSRRPLELATGLATHGTPRKAGRATKHAKTAKTPKSPKGVEAPPAPAPAPTPAWLELSGATLHNIRSVDVRIPVGRLTVLTGISGSGKSTLMRGILKPAVQAALASHKKGARENSAAGLVKSLRGTEFLETVYEVDQAPIGKTSRSTPATYLSVFDDIRSLFAGTPLARMRGYGPGRFSFNTEGGRCETCLGQGSLKIEMNFLPPAHITCPDCGGSRYNGATLEVHYHGRTIADVLAMPMEEAAEFFGNQPALARPLRLLVETGLGYLTLGQPSQTLSGGEAQRLKLVGELARGVGRSETALLRKSRATKSILYLLEEPTIGLHQADVRQLLGVLHRLVDAGHTVVVIEHHTALIAEADYLLEIGPEAGAAGGQLIACGTPEQVMRVPKSRIAPFLSPLLSGATRKLPAR